MTKTQYVPPVPSFVSKAGVVKFGEQQRARVGLVNGFQISDVVRDNGGRLSYIDFEDSDQIDAIIVEPDDSFLIRLSSYTGALRDNFTIAHELGHRLLHWPKVKVRDPGKGMKATRKVDARNSDLVRCEWEANWFASGFLMPEDEFRRHWANGVASEKLGVTLAAAKVRAKTFGLD